MSNIDDIFSFAAHQQTEAYSRIAAYKEKQAAHELLTAQAAHEEVQLKLKYSHQILRPSLMVRPVVTFDGEEWIATYGDCRGHGLTPDLAFQAFDTTWVGKSQDE